MKTRQQEDYELWEEWRKSKDPQVLTSLLDRLNPLIHREVVKWGSAVPRVALESKARGLTVQALDTYDPNKGAAIGTHVASRLRKLSRFVYPYQNVARLPENKQLLYNTFTVAKNKVFDTVGREATTDELVDELGWTPKKVSDFQRSFERRELVESEGAFSDDDPMGDNLVDFYYHGLAPMDKSLFEDVTGYGGKPILNNAQIMKKHNLTQGQLSYQKRKLIDSIKGIQDGRI
jgi:DNA-directed RNA polymerase specialized sigma subunit